MNLNQLKSLPTQDLIDLYNDMAGKQVKRMATRAEAEKRTMEAAKAAGKWEEVIEGTSPVEAKHVHETAKAGANTGNKDRKSAPPATRAGKAVKAVKAKPEKAVKEPKERPAKAQPTPKSGKGKAGGQKAAPKPTPAASKASKKGAPIKNPTFTAIAPTDKAFNPKGFKPQATSDRMVVLNYIRENKGQRTRDQIVAHFAKETVNVDAALYYLGKFGFCRVSE